MSADEWRPSRSRRTSGGEMAYQVLGDGPPVVLVHGTPSWSYLWRGVAARLAERCTVYAPDLLGYGTSEQREGQDVTIPAQAAALAELLDALGLARPSVVGHDIGGAVALRLALDGRASRLALCDAAVLAPWVTPFSRHVREHLAAFAGVPGHIHRELVAAHLRTAFARPVPDEALQAYLAPWLGGTGQPAYYRQVAGFDEGHTADLEARAGELAIPSMVLWGEQDTWIDPAQGKRLAAAIPGARLEVIADGGHFLPEDQPAAVADLLAELVG